MSTVFAFIILIFSGYGIFEFSRKVLTAIKNLKKGENANARKSEDVS